MRTPEVAEQTGASIRQLDWWDRKGIIKPTVRAAMGSGTHREYSNAQVEVIALMVDLIDHGHIAPRTAALMAHEIVATGRSQLSGLLTTVKAWKS